MSQKFVICCRWREEDDFHDYALRVRNQIFILVVIFFRLDVLHMFATAYDNQLNWLEVVSDIGKFY
jgi:hypothetical protein